MEVKVFVDNMMQENTYIYYNKSSKEAVVIDPSMNLDQEKKFIEGRGLDVKYIILTHSHADHIADVEKLKDFTGAKIVASIDEKELLNDANKNLSSQLYPRPIEIEADIYVNDREKLKLGDKTFTFIFTPGHTKGGMCVRCGMDMFTGDTLFKDSIGRTDLYSGNYDHMLKSLKKLSKMENELKVYPGHGPSTTLGSEKARNYYMKLVE